jgi:hypothetical protein
VISKTAGDIAAGTQSPKGGLDDGAKQAQVRLDQYFAVKPK